ncbi:MAG: hypothetical protein SAJ12_14655 [Jaaginema sp. PMC 1079.18]|nr:hypothetical protein [Jaaginema sp. PMC 1080.18]MEC4852225.1 hypothetical protein [Jaaginema sp. PMC 1079.18]MEC4866969.1 hypothetical protein [Jaaginema sp. PMC 1078.18]
MMRRSPYLILAAIAWGFFPIGAIAQTPDSETAPKPAKFAERCVLDPNTFTDEGLPGIENTITAFSFNPDTMTQPSLWWAAAQFSPNKMIDNWSAHLVERNIKLVVNRQLWSSLNYIGHYSFIHHFGTVARDYGYDLYLFDRQENCLASYTCDRDTTSVSCDIEFDPTLRRRFDL